jgi:hypothetical protein
MTFQLTHPNDACVERDRRYTPAWCTEALLFHTGPVRLDRGVPTFDPCGGDGAILRVLRDAGFTDLRTTDIDPGEGLEEFRTPGCRLQDDWLKMDGEIRPPRPFYVVTNPPYSIGPAFMAVTMELRPRFCAALLRLNHLGSASWRKFWQRWPLDGMLILASRRPSFSADGKTDASEYFWAIWDDECDSEIRWI